MNANATRPRQQRQLIALGVLIAALVAVVGYEMTVSDSTVPPPQQQTGPRAARSAAESAAAGVFAPSTRPGTPPRPPAGPRGAKGAAAAANGAVEEVNLAKLQQPEPEPIDGHRNPFSLAPERKPEPPGGSKSAANAVPSVAPPPVPAGPPPVPPPPPITLKFFGVLTAGGNVGKVAALGDGKFVYHGREGEIIEGRYRIVRIGEESIQMEYVDGRGRQTIRLSGK